MNGRLPDDRPCESVRLFEILPSDDVIDYRNRLHIELLYGCALRSGEARDLSLADLDFGERAVSGPSSSSCCS